MGSIGSLFPFYRHPRFDLHQDATPLREAGHPTALRSIWTDPGGALHTPLARATGTKLGLLLGTDTSHNLLFRGGGGGRRYTSPVARFSSSTHQSVHLRRVSTRSCWPSSKGPNGAIFARRISSVANRFFYRGANMNHEFAACTEGDNEHRLSEAMSDDPILEPKHKIFIAHSGVQKEFVEHLCKGLEDRCYYPFFDRRHDSLPKGEKFPELIIRAVEQCQMLVVVVSHQYFMSKWAMIELNAFVKAHELNQESHKSSKGPKILPLFYKLSRGDLGKERRQEKWFKQWETWAKDDSQKRIDVNEWKYALNVLQSFSGLKYNQKSKEIVAYENDIISHISKSISPDIKCNDSFVQGRSSICKVICKKVDQIGPSHNYKVKVVGIYGVAGIGKTTMCKTLCDELSNKYDGRVCHIEFESKNSRWKELLQEALTDLTKKNLEVIKGLNEGQRMNILQKNLFRQRTFLAMDNVWDNYESIKQAKMFLEAHVHDSHFHKGSLVIVTARSRSTLQCLGIDGNACFQMPELGGADAMKLFLYHAAHGKHFTRREDKCVIQHCVRRCYFQKGVGQDFHYHPLALEALGRVLASFGEDPSEWVMNLPKVRNFSYFSGGNPVFGKLRSSFDLLPQPDQSLFMDVVLYFPRVDHEVGDTWPRPTKEKKKKRFEGVAMRFIQGG